MACPLTINLFSVKYIISNILFTISNTNGLPRRSYNQ